MVEETSNKGANVKSWTHGSEEECSEGTKFIGVKIKDHKYDNVSQVRLDKPK
jgi:hypothetical protein